MKTIKDFGTKKLGFGFMRLPVDDQGEIDQSQVFKMVDTFMKQGFSYFDTAYVYHKGQSETALREALVKRYERSQFCIADKMPVFLVKEKEDYEKFFKEQLERCGVDYFDFYLLHSLDEEEIEKVEKTGGFTFLSQKKEEGSAKQIGFSFHGSYDLLDRLLETYPQVDFVQLQINYYDWEDPKIASRKCLEVAKKHQKPVIVMEPIRGGNLVRLPLKVAALVEESGNTPAELALRYAATRDQVAMVLSGMSTLEQVEENTGYLGQEREFTEEEMVLTRKITNCLNEIPVINCTGCRYCVEGCPQNIAIPGLFRMYNEMQKFNQGKKEPGLFERITKTKGHPSSCISCGACEEICPQHLEIRKELAKIALLFQD